MRAFYGSRFSPNMTKTPDGFLICHNVPIARTGWYEYQGKEIGVNDKADEILKVFRSPEEVFSPAAIASFEGMTLTDEHPPEAVTPDNASVYSKGHVQNVLRGSGEENDLLLADLVVKDRRLIDEINQGKREVSAGYECVYEDAGNGKYLQKQIVGNHVAVVKEGRAGDRVAIQDSKPQLPKGEKKMSIKLPKKGVTAFLAAIGVKQFMTDAEPEDIKEVMDALAAEQAAQQDANPPAPGAPQAPAAPQQPQDPAMQMLAEIKALLTQLVQGKATDADLTPEKQIDAAIAELEKPTGDDLGEEETSKTIPAASMDDVGPVSDPEDRPQNPLTGDNAYKVAALKAIKPILAQIKDPAERRRVADAAIASMKGKPADNTYALIKPQKPKTTTDAATADSRQQQIEGLGRKIAEQYNPHYRKQA